MSKTNNGGPAFPQFEVVAGERDGHGDAIEAYTVATGGMSLRDWFAGQALAGISATAMGAARKVGETHNQAHARWAYETADAMLAERAKKGGAS